ncbi:membrane-bound acylglycerophosphatidylinositol O-acyltransferase mboat7-like [Crassostrea virginica]|uniref:Lysophospholipid acyltransferase 7 n=1 Tax=Crassostrea virginica TaxID=6565 RepID=A0A8B8ADA9_CRAVI|nr:lysophospholipid acyltransferase 7-like [Crassostrea virginica]
MPILVSSPRLSSDFRFHWRAPQHLGLQSWWSDMTSFIMSIHFPKFSSLGIVVNHLRVAITMTISAFWHGIYPGYYLSFLLVPLILIAEDNMRAAFRHGSPRRIQCFDWACWFFKMRGFDYMCMGFLLLRLDYTLTYWKSIFFIGHVVTAVFLVTGMLLRKKSKSVGEENKPKLN